METPAGEWAAKAVGPEAPPCADPLPSASLRPAYANGALVGAIMCRLEAQVGEGLTAVTGRGRGRGW